MPECGPVPKQPKCATVPSAKLRSADNMAEPELPSHRSRTSGGTSHNTATPSLTVNEVDEVELEESQNPRLPHSLSKGTSCEHLEFLVCTSIIDSLNFEGFKRHWINSDVDDITPEPVSERSCRTLSVSAGMLFRFRILHSKSQPY